MAETGRLAVATGAGMNKRAIGTGVLGGMITATVLAVSATPLFRALVAAAFRGTIPRPRRPPRPAPRRP